MPRAVAMASTMAYPFAPAPAPAGAPGAPATEAAFSVFVVCPLNVRVGANSPSLWPTMFSVTYTGMNFLPLCTAIVCPTISGITVDRRDQVLMTFLSPPWFIPSIFSRSGTSTNGPFFSERDISLCLRLFLATLDDESIGALRVARLVTLGGDAPRRHRVTAARGLALTAAERVIDRVHRHAADVRADAQPPAAAGLADRDVLVVEI